MKYTITGFEEAGFIIKGYCDDGVQCLDQPFNSFTGNPFTSEEECKEYCIALGYVDSVDVNPTQVSSETPVL